MYNPCLLFNRNILTPSLSRLGPGIAYRMNAVSGMIGKGLNRASFRFEKAASHHAVAALEETLGMERRDAEAVVREFLLIESRVLLEHLWLQRMELRYLPAMTDFEALRGVARTVEEKGPMLLLTAHTAYYFILPWVLHQLGVKIAYVMADPAADPAAANLLTESGIASSRALYSLLPVVYTNQGNTVRRCVDLLSQGYSVLMVLDIPGYAGRGTRVSLFDRWIWIPSGCRWICGEAQVPAASLISSLRRLDRPYEISFSLLPATAGDLDLQRWADELEGVVRRSPASWLGWFYIRDMS